MASAAQSRCISFTFEFVEPYLREDATQATAVASISNHQRGLEEARDLQERDSRTAVCLSQPLSDNRIVLQASVDVCCVEVEVDDVRQRLPACLSTASTLSRA